MAAREDGQNGRMAELVDAMYAKSSEVIQVTAYQRKETFAKNVDAGSNPAPSTFDWRI